MPYGTQRSGGTKNLRWNWTERYIPAGVAWTGIAMTDGGQDHALGADRRLLVAVFVLAVVVRVGFLVATPHPYSLNGLSAPNGEMARNILVHDRWFVINRPGYDALSAAQARTGRLIDPADFSYGALDRRPRFEYQAVEQPGAAILLAALWWVTGSYRYIYLQVAQVVADASMAVLVFWIGMQLFRRRRAAIIAAFGYATFLPIAQLTRIPFHDPWAALVPPVFVALGLKGLESDRPWAWGALAGAGVGFGLYFRFALILMPVLIVPALALFGSWRRAAAYGATALAVGCAMLVPWTVRNNAVYHRFIPANVGFGQTLWEGFGEIKNPGGAINEDVATATMVHRVRPDLRYGTPQYDDYLGHKATAVIRAHPGFYLKLLAVRSARALFWPGGGRLASLSAPPLFALAASGLILCWRKHWRSEVVLLTVIAAVAAVPIMLQLQWRYLAPSTFAYLLLAAAGIDEATTRFERWRVR
jgi:4-amino-4-deoxy-L-arabinose transferase-like glycosyltransferase